MSRLTRRRVNHIAVRAGAMLVAVAVVWSSGVLRGQAIGDTPLEDFRVVPSDRAATVMWYPRGEASGAVIRIGTQAPQGPEDGTAACDGAVSPCRVEGLDNGVEYHVAAFPAGGGDPARAEVKPRDIVAPREVDALRVVRGDRALRVLWADPPVPDLGFVLVRHRPGRRPPTLTSSALEARVPPGRQAFRVKGLKPGAWHSFSVFTVDSSGNVNLPYSISASVVARTRVALRVSSTTVSQGRSVTLRGRVTMTNGVPVASTRVRVRAAYPRQRPRPFATVRTDARGRFVARHTPLRNVRYTARHLGRGPFLPSLSPRISVTVVPGRMLR